MFFNSISQIEISYAVQGRIREGAFGHDGQPPPPPPTNTQLWALLILDQLIKNHLIKDQLNVRGRSSLAQMIMQRSIGRSSIEQEAIGIYLSISIDQSVWINQYGSISMDQSVWINTSMDQSLLIN